MFGPELTLPELAARFGWPKGKRRAGVRPLLQCGSVVRRLVPAGTWTDRRRVVYQVYTPVQTELSWKQS